MAALATYELCASTILQVETSPLGEYDGGLGALRLGDNQSKSRYEAFEALESSHAAVFMRTPSTDGDAWRSTLSPRRGKNRRELPNIGGPVSLVTSEEAASLDGSEEPPHDAFLFKKLDRFVLSMPVTDLADPRLSEHLASQSMDLRRPPPAFALAPLEMDGAVKAAKASMRIGSIAPDGAELLAPLVPSPGRGRDGDDAERARRLLRLPQRPQRGISPKREIGDGKDTPPLLFRAQSSTPGSSTAEPGRDFSATAPASPQESRHSSPASCEVDTDVRRLGPVHMHPHGLHYSRDSSGSESEDLERSAKQILRLYDQGMVICGEAEVPWDAESKTPGEADAERQKQLEEAWEKRIKTLQGQGRATSLAEERRRSRQLDDVPAWKVTPSPYRHSSASTHRRRRSKRRKASTPGEHGGAGEDDPP